MSKIKIGIAEDELITRMDIEGIMGEAGYEVSVSAANGQEMIDLCKLNPVDIAILDVQMPIVNGHEVAKYLLDNRLCKEIIMLTAFSDEQNIESAKQSNAFGYLTKPLDEKTLVTTVEMAFKRMGELGAYQEKIDTLEEQIQSRKTIEKAKKLLIKEHNISENEAYEMIRKRAMDKRESMVKIAKAFITIYE